MKHCIIRHNQLKALTDNIRALSKAGFETLWTFKKIRGEWTATSTRPTSFSLSQLERAVA